MKTLSHLRLVSHARHGFFGVILVIFAGLQINLIGQEILFQETFETDGNGSRYTVEGGDVYELDRIQSELGNADMKGAIYWARNSDISFVGVPAPTPEKRGIMAWHHSIAAEDVTEDFLSFFDSVVSWMTGGKAKATILFSPPPSGEGDFVLVERLESKGHTVLEDDAGGDLPDPSSIDAVIKSSSGGSPSRFATYAVPLVTYRSSDHDDMLVSSIGQTLTADIGPVTIAASEHPAAGGATGDSVFVKNTHSFDLAGAFFPGNATVVASFKRVLPASVDSIEEAMMVIAGELPSQQSKATISEADLVAAANPASGGVFDGDFEVPGNPDGGFVTVSRGKIEIATAGTIALAIGADDGAFLRIDLDKNGLNDEDHIMSLDGTGSFRYTTTDVEFPKGTFDFEWVAYNATGAFGSEFLSAYSIGDDTPSTIDDFDWEPVSGIGNAIKLVGSMDVTTYALDLPPEEDVIPFFIALESPGDGGAVFGGGPFAGFEGEGFFAGSGLNKFAGSKSITWNAPVDVAGKDKLKMTVALAATFLDFETSDYLNIYIDDGDPLMSFSAPSGNDQFFSDQVSNGESPTRLDLRFQDVTYDIPDGTPTIDLRIEANTTWWNEIVGIDNIRITSGEKEVLIPELSLRRDGMNLILEWKGMLQSATEITGPWVDFGDDSQSPIVLEPGDLLPAQFARAVAP